MLMYFTNLLQSRTFSNTDTRMSIINNYSCIIIILIIVYLKYSFIHKNGFGQYMFNRTTSMNFNELLFSNRNGLAPAIDIVVCTISHSYLANLH